MPTIQQLVRKGRQDKVAKQKTAALKGSPQRRRPFHDRHVRAISPTRSGTPSLGRDRPTGGMNPARGVL